MSGSTWWDQTYLRPGSFKAGDAVESPRGWRGVVVLVDGAWLVIRWEAREQPAGTVERPHPMTGETLCRRCWCSLLVPTKANGGVCRLCREGDSS